MKNFDGKINKEPKFSPKLAVIARLAIGIIAFLPCILPVVAAVLFPGVKTIGQ